MVEAQAAAAETSHSVSAGATYWFTGLSGAGKSTLSGALKEQIDKLVGDNKKVFLLDGDVIRTGLNKDLGFSKEDRAENIRRIAEVSKLFCLAGQVVFVAFISPYSADRDFAKEVHEAAGLKFYECHISATLEVCEGRDVKGLYAKARAGIIPKFTGVSDPYEAPSAPAMDINTGTLTLEQCQTLVINHMTNAGVLRNNNTRVVSESMWKDASEAEATEFAGLPVLDIDQHQVEYLQTIGDGWANPLKRFMNELELLEVMNMKTITDSEGKRHLLSVPITQSVTAEQKAEFEGKTKIAIKCSAIGSDAVLAVIDNPVFFDNRKEEICARTFGCMSKNHPKAETIFAQGDFLVSGDSMRFVSRPVFNDGNDQYRLTPTQIQAAIVEKDADVVYAFQVRNPLHNGHVLLLKDTRE
jgi:3'-phosphoadenosine 5'-phosphosulfate synthase